MLQETVWFRRIPRRSHWLDLHKIIISIRSKVFSIEEIKSNDTLANFKNQIKMETANNPNSHREKNTVETTVKAPIEKVWNLWTLPGHIIKWNRAADDWHTPGAENDLRAGGKFVSRMEARDGSSGFDFGGVYDEVKTNELISYTMDDGRKVKVTFINNGNDTKVIETFDAENENSVEMQRTGWQAILDNFKKYAESN